MSDTKIKVDWELKNLDTGEVLRPPYPVSEDGVKYPVGGTYTDQPRFGMDPVSSWIGGKSRPYQFSTVLFAETTADDIRGKFNAIKRLAEPDEALGRPPICVFSYAGFDAMVLVENVDVEIKPPREDGSPRLITLSFTLKRYKPFSQVQIDPTKPSKESYYLVVASPEACYEQIAKRYYGSALAGDRIRKRHPAMPMQPTVGSKVELPSRSIILREVVQPSYHAFCPTDVDATKAFQDLLNRRAGHKVVL